MAFGGGLYCVAKGRQHLSSNLSKPFPYMLLVKPLKKHLVAHLTVECVPKKCVNEKTVASTLHSLKINLHREADTVLFPEGSIWPGVG